MIPLKLKIKGVYSYRNAVEIDFSKLTKAGLFGIFGAVGSGKSTILEAISYAMYGETERLNKRDSKQYNMMNLRGNEMEIDFKLKHQQQTYRFWSYARRNSKQFDQISKSERKAYRLVMGQWEPLESADATEIIGLKYEHFKQIVIIPQGKFNDFVQLSPQQRSDMLKELFPLERFDLKDPVNRLYAKTKTAISELEGRLQELAEYTQEQLSEVEVLLKNHQQKVETEKTALKKLESEQKEAENLKKLVDSLKTTRGEHAILERKKPEFDKLAGRIDRYEKVRLRYQPLLQRIVEITEDIVRLQQAEAKQKAQLKSVVEKLAASVGKTKDITDRYGDQEQHKEQLNNLSKAVQVLELQGKLIQTTAQLEKRHKELSTETELREAKKGDLKKLKQSVSRIKSSIPDEAALYALQASYKDEDNLQERLKSSQKEVGKVEKLIAELKEQRDTIMNGAGRFLTEKLPEGLIKLADAEQYLRVSIKARHSIIDELSGKKQKLEVNAGLAKFARSLQHGEKCPLCGSPEHPEPFSDDSLEREKKVLETKLEEQNKAVDGLKEALVQLTALKDRFRREGGEMKEREQQVEQIENKLKTCLEERKKISISINREQLKESLNSLEQQKTKLKGLDKQISMLENQLDDNTKLSALEKQVRELETTRTSILSQIELQKQGHDPEWFNLSIEELTGQKKEVVQRISRLEKLSDDIQNLEKKQHTIEVELMGTGNQLQAQQGRLTIKENELNKQLEEDRYGNKDEVVRILGQQIDVQSERQRVESFQQRLQVSISRVNDLEEQIGERQFDPEKYSQVVTAVNQKQESVHEMENQAGAYQNRHQVLVEKVNQKKLLQKQFDGLEKRKTNLDVLVRLFRGDGFVKYVSRIYLKQLCSIANHRFKKLTHNQLELDIDDKYNFVVRDFLHDGHTRLLKTLSGGQTFQAALSLAMALSEQIQQYQNVKQQFFFMDEGFGSLDRQSLSLVFDTLKQLRKEQRTVGIISHVEELQSEIDQFLMIENNEDEGSIIKWSV